MAKLVFDHQCLHFYCGKRRSTVVCTVTHVLPRQTEVDAGVGHVVVVVLVVVVVVLDEENSLYNVNT